MRTRCRALADAGCRYLQFDDTNLAYLCDEKCAKARAARRRPERAAAPLREAYQRGDRRPAGGHDVCMHLCRGNFKSAWAAEGGYEPVAERFQRAAVDGYFLEYDDARSGDFAPLRYVPKGKTVVLGLVTTKVGQLETKDAIKRRIDEAAKFVPLEQFACRRNADSRAPCMATTSRESAGGEAARGRHRARGLGGRST